MKKLKICLIFILLLFLLSVFLDLKLVHPEKVETSKDFLTLFPSGLNLCFQQIKKPVGSVLYNVEYVRLMVVSGTLNGSKCRLNIHEGGGTFKFHAEDEASIKLVYTADSVKVKGDQGRDLRAIPSPSIINIDPGDTVAISWVSTIPPMLPIMFLFGVAGIGTLIFSPLYVVYKFKRQEYYDALRTGVLLFAIGIAFSIAWLWG